MAKKQDEKRAENLAKELGLNTEALTQEDEVVVEEQPKSAKKSKQKTEKKEAKQRKRVADLTKERDLLGFPVNHLSKPLEFDEQGNPQELVVTFNKEEVAGYREENGRIFLEIHRAKYRKKGGDTLKVIAEQKGKDPVEIISTNNHSRGWKRAKTWAMLLNLAFDPEKDVKHFEKDNSEEVK